METIYALSSAPGRAGVAVVRVSGPGASSVIAALTGRPAPRPRLAVIVLLQILLSDAGYRVMADRAIAYSSRVRD